MSSLRQKQIQEVLDEDIMANRAVFMREKKNVAVEAQQILPKKQGDMVSEVGIIKGIEGLNAIIEKKLLAMEKFLSSSGKNARELTEIETSGDAVSAYNAIVRLYLASGFSRDSQDIVKNQFQQLQSNIDAIVYGYNQTIDFLFSEAEPSKSLMNIMRASCIYRAINDQLFESGANINPRPLSQSDLEIELKDYLATLSTERQSMLRALQGDIGGPAPSITALPLRNFPVLGDNVDERIRALEYERGFTIPESVKLALRRIAPLEAEANVKSVGDSVAAIKSSDNDIAMIRTAIAGVNQSKAEIANQLDVKRQELTQLRQALDDAYTAAESRGEEQILMRDEGYQDGIQNFSNLSAEIKSLLANQQKLLQQNIQLEGQLASANQRRRELNLAPIVGKTQPVFRPEEEEVKLAYKMELPRNIAVNSSTGMPDRRSKEYKQWIAENPEQEEFYGARARSASASASRRSRSRGTALERVKEAESGRLTPPAPSGFAKRANISKKALESEFAAQASSPKTKGEGHPHFRHRGLASMRPQYGHAGESESESDCGCDSDCECECGCHREQHHYGRIRTLGYDDTRNEMYNC